MRRLAAGGLIDRGRRLALRFDGRAVAAHPGDTLASALLAGGIAVVGRSFKYHRPRGVLAAGAEEPNALVTLGPGAAATPNLPATTIEAFDGLVAASQNRWPSLGFDLGAAAGLAAPLIGAGFYYKTFMWPKAAWERIYEPVIRRAAGLGRLTGAPDAEPRETAFAFCDLLVIGAGPAGLMAARVAGRAGARVILADADFVPGGRLLAERETVGGVEGAAWAAATAAELDALPNVVRMPRTTVTGAYDGGTFGALERVGEHLATRPDALPATCFWRIAARRTVLATGAVERLVAFPGNGRPGVMLAGAVRAYLHRWAVAPTRAVIFAAHDDGARTAADLAAAGVEVAAVIGVRRAASGPWPSFPRGAVEATHGRLRLRGVVVRDASGGRHRIAADCLAVSGGWNPAVALACHLGARPVWDDARGAFLAPAGAVAGMAVAGAAAGAVSTRAALAEGAAAAAAALGDLGFAVPAVALPEAADGAVAAAPIWRVAIPGRAFVDLQNDVTVKDLETAAAEGFGAAEHAKRYTTLGMATDQGKTGGMAGMAVLAEVVGRRLSEVGVTTFRPPYAPVPIAALGAGGAGAGFAPERRTPAHAVAARLGARFVEAGEWFRAAWFGAAREDDWRVACAREAAMVRATVGVADVTTLGKIEVQGPDAARFLDRVYANRIATLAIGRVRYGLMLREDGFVLDDGTVARLAERHFLLTTTTAAAASVLAHLEFCAECLWPKLDVAIVPVSEAWAQVAVAGPRARAVLAEVVAEPIDALPFMGVMPATAGGVAARLFRISFSGELGFELAVPARHGAALFETLAERAAAAGGGPYGLEALNVLRIEKGFLTHAEIDGRTTADDLGLGRMLKAGEFVGKAGAAREGLMAPGREQLVGLRPLAPGGRLLAGAHVLAPGAAAVVANDLGHVTSACASPGLGPIALALVQDGRARIGEEVRAVCLLRGEDVRCRVTDACFLDPAGERMRG